MPPYPTRLTARAPAWGSTALSVSSIAAALSYLSLHLHLHLQAPPARPVRLCSQGRRTGRIGSARGGGGRRGRRGGGGCAVGRRSAEVREVEAAGRARSAVAHCHGPPQRHPSPTSSRSRRASCHDLRNLLLYCCWGFPVRSSRCRSSFFLSPSVAAPVLIFGPCALLSSLLCPVSQMFNKMPEFVESGSFSLLVGYEASLWWKD